MEPYAALCIVRVLSRLKALIGVGSDLGSGLIPCTMNIDRKKNLRYQVQVFSGVGNPVKIGSEPVAVTGDENGKQATDRVVK